MQFDGQTVVRASFDANLGIGRAETPANYADQHMLTRATSELSMWMVTTLVVHR